jgi:hypothetical protein
VIGVRGKRENRLDLKRLDGLDFGFMYGSFQVSTIQN